MRPHYQSMNIPSPIAAGPGNELMTDRFRDKAVQVFGASWSAGNVSLEGSNDGVTWTAVGSALTAAGWIQVPHAVQYLRVVLGAGITATSITAIFGGLDSRSE
jgi:hypothetical protein